MNAVILGASFDTPEENEAFRAKFDFPFDLLCDTGREMGLAYGAADAPDAGHAARISYLIDPEGRIARAYGSVKPAVHPEEVLTDLRSLAS